MNWLARRKFLALLLALLLLLVGHPMLHGLGGERILYEVLVTVVFLASLLVIFTQARLRFLAILVGLPTIVAIWTGYAVPGLPRQPLVLSFHICAVLFLALAVAAVVAGIIREERVSTDSVFGAFCGYLLLGVIFGHLYSIQELIRPGSFHELAESAPQLSNPSLQRSVLTYFSFVTLTTVGYGDITPANAGARSLAVVEAVIGQFYVAGLIAELIGKKVAQAIANQPASSRDRERPAAHDARMRGI